VLSESSYGRTWHTARALALGPEAATTALSRGPYDLRHAALSLWLNAGAAPAQIARRAGHNITVLLTVYAHCIDGQDDITNRQIGPSGVTARPGAARTPPTCPAARSRRARSGRPIPRRMARRSGRRCSSR
jgi:hypothetical protein